MGIYQPASLGDRVWYDTNANGVQDAGEDGVEGVTVVLYDVNDTPVATTTTDVDGIYAFTNLVPGDYYVVFTPLSGYVLSPQDNSGDDTADSDVDPTTGATILTTLSSGENDPTWDAGLYEPAGIGDRVWYDNNRDGVQDSGETGVENVEVELLDANGTVVLTTTTDASGYYSFTNLMPDNYSIHFVLDSLPTGYVVSPQDNSGDDATDSDADATTGTTIQTTLDAGEYDPTWDMGIYLPTASLGDLVWEDLNHDGVQDPNEPGIPGVVVTLTDSNGLTQTVTTDANGNYTFPALISGEPYTVTFVTPDGYMPTTPNAGDDALDSDGAVVVVNLQPGEHNPTIDSGFWRPAGIGDRVWYDDNRNGMQDGGENGVADVTVELLGSNGQIIDTTTTDPSGYYSFTNLIPGDYSVRFIPGTLPADYALIQPDQGGNDDADSDADPTTGATIVTNLQPGEYDPTWDAGIVLPLVSLGDLVWIDGDRDGVQDSGEVGVPGIVVSLALGDGTRLTTTTDATGHYIFPDLVPNQQVTVTFILPAGYSVTTPNTGDDTLDSDSSNNGVVIVNLGASDDFTIDAGLIVDPVVVGDRTFIDANGDGVQDGGDQPLPGVVLHLTNADGTPATDILGSPVSDQTTDANGTYLFDNLPPGEYTVGVVSVPTGYLPTTANVGDPANDSATGSATSSPTTGTAAQPGGEDRTLDFGFVPVVNLGNLVWLDSNNNGQVDNGEPGIPGVTVQLFREGDDPTAATPVMTDVTDSNGNYLFANLEPGRYFVYIPTPPADYPMSSTPTDTADNGEDNDDNGSQIAPGAPVTSPVIELTVIGEPVNDGDAENGDLTVDFAFIPLLDLGNLVWHDVNNNGQVDEGEEGVSGVTVQLFHAGDDPATATPLATDVTDENGNYLFENLEPGAYIVYIPTPPQQYPVSTVPTDGNDNGEDNDDNGAQDQRGQPVRSPVIDLQVGMEPASDGDDVNGDLTVDFGFFALASLGDLVWFDLDTDGVQDAQETGVPGTLDERGVPNVTVILYDAISNSIVATTTTDTHGRYLFADLLPGSYVVEFEMPVDYLLSIPDQGANDAFDSDVNPITMRTPVTVLESGEHNPTLDMGLYLPDATEPAAIGDFVWYDADSDGLQDESELGVPGVTVTLYRSDGAMIATAVTDVDGFYQFNSLPPGDYYVQFTLPAGYGVSPQNAGDNDDIDSDVQPVTRRTVVTTLEPGEYDPSWDLGLTLTTPPASIGDTVWYDADADGIQDPEESGVPGISVTLYRADGTIVATTRTDADGHYEFINLPPGDYFLEFTPRPGYLSTLPDRGGDDSADSDVDPATRRTAMTTLEPGENDMTWDYGLLILDNRTGELRVPATIGNRVWEDANQDGIQGEPVSEPSVPGVTVKLYDGDGQIIAIDVTDENGEYLFPNLLPGEYYIEFVLPDGYVITVEGTDPLSDVDSNVDPNTGRTPIEVLEYGEMNPTLDAGIYRTPLNLGDEDEPQQTLPLRIYLPVIQR
ncbi:MAG: SdrD B-like domain-containing protein [Caldilineaceae bacterium]